VELECAETTREEADQLTKYNTMLEGLVESCKNICSVDVFFNKAPDAEIQTGTDHAKLCISQAYTALKAVCDDEDARIEIERAARKAARLSLDKDDSQDEGDDSWDNWCHSDEDVSVASDDDGNHSPVVLHLG
jgi:hypothetical protein